MATPNDSLFRFTAHGKEFSIWHEDEAEVMWINARSPGASSWDGGVNVSVYEPSITAAGGAEAFVKAKALPAFNAYVAKYAPSTGGPAPLPPTSFPVGPVVAAVRELVARRLAWNGSALVIV